MRQMEKNLSEVENFKITNVPEFSEEDFFKFEENNKELIEGILPKKNFEISRFKKPDPMRLQFIILNYCFLTWINSKIDPNVQIMAPKGSHVFEAFSNETKDFGIIRSYFGVCNPKNYKTLTPVTRTVPIKHILKKTSYCIHEINGKLKEKHILIRCICGFWGSQSQKKDHGCPFKFEYKTSLNDIYQKYNIKIVLKEKEKEKKDNSNFQFKTNQPKVMQDPFVKYSKEKYKFQFYCGLKEKKFRENLVFLNLDGEYTAVVELKDFTGKDEFYVSFKHFETDGLEYVVNKTKVEIKSTEKSFNTTPTSTKTPKSAKSQTLYLRISEFSKKCSITYMLILYCSIKKVPLEKMKNDYMISNDDLINQRDSDDLKKDIFDLDKNAILGKNGLFWLIFFNQDDSNLLEQLQHEFKEEFEHQMKFVEKYRKVDSGLISRIKDIVLDYRYGFDQSIQDYIDSLEYDEEEEE
jgi:hypothetical protein